MFHLSFFKKTSFIFFSGIDPLRISPNAISLSDKAARYEEIEKEKERAERERERQRERVRETE